MRAGLRKQKKLRGIKARAAKGIELTNQERMHFARHDSTAYLDWKIDQEILTATKLVRARGELRDE